MASIDIEVIPDEESFPDSSSHVVSKRKSSTDLNPHDLESELIDMNNGTMADEDSSTCDASMNRKAGLIKYTVFFLVVL